VPPPPTPLVVVQPKETDSSGSLLFISVVFACVVFLSGLACCCCFYSRRTKAAAANEALRTSLDLVVSAEVWHQAPSAMVPYNPLRRSNTEQVCVHSFFNSPRRAVTLSRFTLSPVGEA